MKKSILLFSLVLFTVIGLHAQTGIKVKLEKPEVMLCKPFPVSMHLNGMVRDSILGDELPFAVIQIEGTDVKVRSDMKGVFKLPVQLENINSKIRVSYVGYIDQIISLDKSDFQRGHQLAVDMRLDPNVKIKVLPVINN